MLAGIVDWCYSIPIREGTRVFMLRRDHNVFDMTQFMNKSIREINMYACYHKIR